MYFGLTNCTYAHTDAQTHTHTHTHTHAATHPSSKYITPLNQDMELCFTKIDSEWSIGDIFVLLLEVQTV